VSPVDRAGAPLLGDLSVVYVFGTYETEVGQFRLGTFRYQQTGLLPPANHAPDKEAYWPDLSYDPEPQVRTAKGMAVVKDSGGKQAIHVYAVAEIPNSDAAYGSDALTIAYDENLKPMWTAVFNHGNDVPVAIAANEHHVAVAVRTTGSNGDWDIQILFYNASDGTLVFSDTSRTRFSTPGNDWPADIAFAGGKAIVTGTTRDPATSLHKFWTARYNPLPDPPQADPLEWATLSGVSNKDNIATDLFILENTTIYITGFTEYASGLALTRDYFTTRLHEGNGAHAWTGTPPAGPPMVNFGLEYDGPDHKSDRAVKVFAAHNAGDGATKVYVTGQSESLDTGMDIATVKYIDSSSYATMAWENILQSWPNGEYFGGNDAPADMTGWLRKNLPPAPPLHRDEIFVTGYRTNAQGNRDYITIKYREDLPNSRASWYILYPLVPSSPGWEDAAAAIAVTGLGSDPRVFVTGRSEGGASLDDYLTIRYRDNEP